MEKKIADKCFARFPELEKAVLLESNRQLENKKVTEIVSTKAERPCN